mgnify:CR=1 FL=1
MTSIIFPSRCVAGLAGGRSASSSRLASVCVNFHPRGRDALCVARSLDCSRSPKHPREGDRHPGLETRNLDLRKVRPPLQFSSSLTGPLSRAVSSPMHGCRLPRLSDSRRSGAVSRLRMSTAVRRASLISLSAAQSSLARRFDGHEPTGRKFVNVRKHGGEIRNV